MQPSTPNADGVWQFHDLPIYGNGRLSPVLYRCGYCLYEGQDPSFMHLITETTSAAFAEWLGAAKQCGAVETFSNAIDDNRYAALRTPAGGRYWCAYRSRPDSGIGEVRIISESAATAPLESFGYTLAGSSDTAFYLYNMNSGAEDTYLIRTADRHWIIIDGGTCMYNGIDPNGDFGDGLYRFIRDQGLGPDEKPVISCWYLTHAHRDHFLGFQALLERHGNDVVLERIVANVPDPAVADHNTNMPCFRRCMETVQRFFPNVPYLKAHEGMKIPLADATFTVLGAQETVLPYWTENRDVFHAKWKNFRKEPDAPDYEFRRRACKLYDINNSSLISLIDVNGLSVLELGDAFRAEEWMFPYFRLETLKPDILKAAHHFNNDELIPTYCSLCKGGRPYFILVNSVAFARESNARRLGEVLSPKQLILRAQLDRIFLFRRRRGKVEAEEMRAVFSYSADHPEALFRNKE